MEVNSQIPERSNRQADGVLEVFKVWPTFQGEGPFAGDPAVFIRLAGCNLQCPACDTDYTSQRSTLTPNEILKLVEVAAQDTQIHLVVMTGGEPFRQNITPLTQLLLDAGFMVQVETNGMYHLPNFPYEDACVVCSPKGRYIHRDLQPDLGAIKYVLRAGEVDPTDGLPLFALGNDWPLARLAPEIREHIEVYLQPLDEQDEIKNKANLEACMTSCVKYGYRLSVQVHKIIGVE